MCQARPRDDGSPAGITYEDARISEVQHFFGVPEPQSLERDTLVNRSCD